MQSNHSPDPIHTTPNFSELDSHFSFWPKFPRSFFPEILLGDHPASDSLCIPAALKGTARRKNESSLTSVFKQAGHRPHCPLGKSAHGPEPRHPGRQLRNLKLKLQKIFIKNQTVTDTGALSEPNHPEWNSLVRRSLSFFTLQ